MSERRRETGYVEEVSAPAPGHIEPGDYFEDCRYHPAVCVRIDYDEDDIVGLSLVDGSPSGCSLSHCGVRKLSFDEALAIKRLGLNWTHCRHCGHSQVDHRDLNFGGCDEEGGCDCAHPWEPAEALWGGF
jgi:hypothetical protein